MGSRYPECRAASGAAWRDLSTPMPFPVARSWLLHRLFAGLAGEVEGHVEMLLDVVETLLLEEVDGRLVVGGGVDDDHPHPLLQHAAPEFVEQPAPHAPLLDIPAHPKPDQVAVFPRRVVLLDSGPQGKAQD